MNNNNDNLHINVQGDKKGKIPGNAKVNNYLCVRKATSVKRVARLVAERLVREEGYSFCPRSVWKTEVRAKGLAVKFVAPVVTEEIKKKAKKVKTDKPRKGAGTK